MSATTVKIDDDLLKEIRRVIPKKQTITTFVRESIRSEVKRRTLREAAETYVRFMAAQKNEKQEMDDWQASALESDILDEDK